MIVIIILKNVILLAVDNVVDPLKMICVALAFFAIRNSQLWGIG